MFFFFIASKSHLYKHKKTLDCSTNWAECCGLQSLDRKCRPTKGQEEVASINVWEFLQEEQGGERRGEGRRKEWETWMEREERRKRREREAGRDGSEGAGGLGGGSVFVLCVKCDHVLELLRQLGSSPAPGSQLVTVGGDTRAAEPPG